MDLAKRTLEKAIRSQSGIDLKQLILHSDQGSQYTSREFTEFCIEKGITQSMSKAGYENLGYIVTKMLDQNINLLL